MIMSSTSTDSVVRQEVVVDLPPERAFSLFVEQFDRIKPREHNLLSVPIAESVFEPRVGGSVYDRGEDGSVCRWARVLAYQPPDRFVISWDIT
ncbi:MAG TPA: ATPase, partial [Microlunatus sp.]|nr:ATPase [Microlunatus sp.]